jgi:hypothetical protein
MVQNGVDMDERVCEDERVDWFDRTDCCVHTLKRRLLVRIQLGRRPIKAWICEIIDVGWQKPLGNVSQWPFDISQEEHAMS